MGKVVNILQEFIKAQAILAYSISLANGKVCLMTDQHRIAEMCISYVTELDSAEKPP